MLFRSDNGAMLTGSTPGGFSGRLYIGNGTGVKFQFLARASSVDTTVGTISDLGLFNALSGYATNGSSGLTVVKTVRAGGGASDCTETFTGGILTASTCP